MVLIEIKDFLRWIVIVQVWWWGTCVTKIVRIFWVLLIISISQIVLFLLQSLLCLTNVSGVNSFNYIIVTYDINSNSTLPVNMISLGRLMMMLLLSATTPTITIIWSIFTLLPFRTCNKLISNLFSWGLQNISWTLLFSLLSGLDNIDIVVVAVCSCPTCNMVWWGFFWDNNRAWLNQLK